MKSHPLLKEGHKRKEALVSLIARKLLIEMFGRKVFLKIKEMDIIRHSLHKSMWEKAEKLAKKYILNRKRTQLFYLIHKR